MWQVDGLERCSMEVKRTSPYVFNGYTIFSVSQEDRKKQRMICGVIDLKQVVKKHENKNIQ